MRPAARRVSGQIKRCFAVFLASLVCVFPFVYAKRHSSTPAATAHSVEMPATPRAGYVGDDACRSCHADQFATYHQTAHYQTSMAPSRASILGSFTTGENILKTANPNLYFEMD